jgi:exopolysaccharide biosynthesis WecB/TagA/CpsF family protein
MASAARFILIAVGSPQQELIAAAICDMPDARGTGLCIGAAIDYLAGRERRAPRWMRRLALEWLHRLLVNPARMWRRYLVDGPRIFLLAWRFRKSSMERRDRA